MAVIMRVWSVLLSFLPRSWVVRVIAGNRASIKQEFTLFLHLLLLSEVKFAPASTATAATQGSAVEEEEEQREEEEEEEKEERSLITPRLLCAANASIVLKKYIKVALKIIPMRLEPLLGRVGCVSER